MKRVRRSRALVPVSTEACPDCDAPTEPVTLHEAALVRHGGYGATRKTITKRCTALGCDWKLETEVSEVTPR